jgi:hypothetical protein
VNVHLDEWAIPDDFEAVNLAGLDDENVHSATFKRLSVHSFTSEFASTTLQFT